RPICPNPRQGRRPRRSTPSSRPRAPARPSSPPTPPRPRRCSTPAAWPTRRWSSAATPCSPRTSASRAAASPRRWPASRRPPAGAEEIAARHDVLIATIAHAGDGNLHPLLITPHGDEAAKRRAQAAFDDIVDAALALGGTVTGEHGVGLLKLPGMRAELGPGV